MAKRKTAAKDTAIFAQPTPARAGVTGSCPRCGEGKLFAGLLAPAKACANCQMDFGFIDSGDGPAVFVILIIGFVITGLAMVVEVNYSPPIWVHMVLWTPAIIGLSIWALRVCKGIMIALQYQAGASEGEIAASDQDPT